MECANGGRDVGGRRVDVSVVTGTFSIVAVDLDALACGAAVASKYPAVGDIVPHVRGGVGAFCTQHHGRPDWGPVALGMLAGGMLPEEVLGALLRDDPGRDKRQLAIIDMRGRAANRNPAHPDPDCLWCGAMSGLHYACQGSALVHAGVLTAMAQAYETCEGSLADRLMAALVAGDAAGGDHRGRCSAAICVASMGAEAAPFRLHVDGSRTAVSDLGLRYVAATPDLPR